MSLIFETKIYQTLKQRSEARHPLAIKYKGLVDASLGKMALYLSEIRRYFHHFTDHSITHSTSIISKIGDLLELEQLNGLSNTELYLLIGSALIHDIGMVVAEHEARILKEDPLFQEERKKILPAMGFAYENDWTLGGVERVVVAEYVRQHHGKRCTMNLNTSGNPANLLTGGDQELIKWLGRISEGHSLAFSKITDTSIYPTDVMVGSIEHANIQFLAICLRIGDLLDIRTPRADPILYNLSQPLEILSQAHWDQYNDIHLQNVAPNKNIKISGTCPTQDAERVLREWIKWLEDECERSTVTLNTCSPQYRIHIGRIEYEVKPMQNEHGQPRYEFNNYRFCIDEERIFKRLFGNRLYGRPLTALRELIQNAIDATRVRVVYERSQKPDWQRLSLNDKKKVFEKEYLSRSSDLEIKVILKPQICPKTGREKLWLHISDQGIGMSHDVIQRYLLTIGRSRWQEDIEIKKLGITTIGKFGIGFLSMFMISDQTIIETQSCLPTDERIHATIYNWKGYLATETRPKLSSGTTVSLLLKPEVCSSFKDIVNTISYWCPFLELPLKIEDENGIITLLPIKKASLDDPNKDKICFPFSSDGSLAVITENPLYIKGKPLPSVCQDGLIVPDLPPPIREIPEQSILRSHGIRIDLRGSDRFPLDLSRNLIKGGADKFWQKLVPQIWRGLVKNALECKRARATLAEFVQSSYDKSFGKVALVVGSNKCLQKIKISKIVKFSSIQFVDKDDLNIESYAKSSTASLILPNIPEAMYYYPTNRKDDYWEKMGETNAPYFAQDPISFNALNEYKNTILDNYEYASEGAIDNSKLEKKKYSQVSVPLEKLGFIRISQSWYFIRNPENGSWETLHKLNFNGLYEIIGRKLGNQLSLSKFVLLSLFDLWPDISRWEAGWRIKSGGSLSDFIYAAIDKCKFSLKAERYEYDKDEIDRKEDEEFYEEEEKDKVMNLRVEQERRAERYKMSNDASEDLLFMFAKKVLTKIDTRSINSCFTPWDIKSWNLCKWYLQK